MAGEASEAVAHRPRAPDSLGGTRRSLGTVRTPGVLGDAPADIVVVESASVAARGHFAASRPRTRAGAAGERRPPRAMDEDDDRKPATGSRQAKLAGEHGRDRLGREFERRLTLSP